MGIVFLLLCLLMISESFARCLHQSKSLSLWTDKWRGGALKRESSLNNKPQRKKRNLKKSGLTTVKERFDSVTKQGKMAYRNIFRQGKIWRSSHFEATLLKATWPSDVEVPKDTLNLIVKQSIPSFKYNKYDSNDMDSDPYTMTLHKLWAKMCEDDWRTATKSLHILHIISRESTSEHCKKFASSLKSLSRARNPRAPEYRYFDTRRFTDAPFSENDGVHFEQFVHSYSRYVVQRVKSFSGRFRELSELRVEKASEAEALVVLKKAQQLIGMGLECSVGADRSRANAITGQVTRAVANDLRDMMKLLAVKVAPLLPQSSTRYQQSATAGISPQELTQLLQSYSDCVDKVQSFLAASSKTFAILGMKMPPPLSPAEVLPGDKLPTTRSGSSVTKLSGGARRVHHSSEDEEEQEEEESEEEEEEDDEGDYDDDDDDDDGDDDDDENDGEEEEEDVEEDDHGEDEEEDDGEEEEDDDNE